MKPATTRWILFGLLAVLVIVFLTGCAGGANYSVLKPNPQKMIDQAELVYRGDMPCLVYIGTAGGADDSFAFATCDWSKFTGE